MKMVKLVTTYGEKPLGTYIRIKHFNTIKDMPGNKAIYWLIDLLCFLHVDHRTLDFNCVYFRLY